MKTATPTTEHEATLVHPVTKEYTTVTVTTRDTDDAIIAITPKHPADGRT